MCKVGPGAEMVNNQCSDIANAGGSSDICLLKFEITFISMCISDVHTVHVLYLNEHLDPIV